MRKETAKIVKAFIAGEHASAARTMTDGQAVYLHGHKIFWRDESEPGVFHFSMCGWGTVTTRDRLNALLGAVWDSKFNRPEDGKVWEAGRWGVFQRKGVQYLHGQQGDTELNENGVYTVA